MILSRRTGVAFAKQFSPLSRSTFFHPPFHRSRFVSYRAQPTYTAMFNQLKHKGLVNSLNKISSSDNECYKLHYAIKMGEHECDIFADEQCSSYLLALLRDGKIDVNTAVSVYHYLLTLMQFSNLQPLRSEDINLKLERRFKMVNIAENFQLTRAGEEYLKTITRAFEKFDVIIDWNDFVKFTETLSGAECWLTEFEHHHPYYSGYDHMMQIICNLVPFFAETSVGSYYLPSHNIINYLLEKMTPEPVLIQPVFDNTGHEEFLLLRLQGLHPGALYHTAVTDNLVSMHGIKGGPFASLAHDYAHVFWLNLFTLAERNEVYYGHAHKLELARDQAAARGWDESAHRFDTARKAIIDFDLYDDTQAYHCPATRLTNYLKKFQKILAIAEESLASKLETQTRCKP